MSNQPLVTPKSTIVSQLFMFLGCLLLGYFMIGPLLGFFALKPILSDLSTQGMLNFMANPTDDAKGRTVLLVFQGVASLVGFIVVPLLFRRYLETKPSDKLTQRSATVLMMLLTVLITLVIIPVMEPIIRWNAGIKLPEFLAEFEKLAQQKEQQIAQITALLTNIENLAQFFFTLIVIAVLPGVGEELVFRGIIQKKLGYLINPHVAIWLSAFLFSALHLQYFGLVPRMLLGVLFGYLYYWSGNLWLPILAHFINNGFTLLMIYLYKIGWVSFDIQKVTYSIVWIILSFVGTAALLWVIYKRTRQTSATINASPEYAVENN